MVSKLNTIGWYGTFVSKD